MRRLPFVLSILSTAAIAATPPTEADRVADRPLPLAPTRSESQVTCTAVVTIGDEGTPKEVGVAAGESCQGPWAQAAQKAVSKWRWSSESKDAKGHVTVVWVANQDVTSKVTDAPGLRIVRHIEPIYPTGAAARDLGVVVCRAMVGVATDGSPAVVTIDACPSEFQAEAANAALTWKWEPPNREGLTRTWSLVTFRPTK
jgi:hypothetical protein